MNTITWGDFEKIDMRVGTILEVNDFPKARKPAYQLTLDFGELGIKKGNVLKNSWRNFDKKSIDSEH